MHSGKWRVNDNKGDNSEHYNIMHNYHKLRVEMLYTKAVIPQNEKKRRYMPEIVFCARHLSRGMMFPTIWHFDMNRLR